MDTVKTDSKQSTARMGRGPVHLGAVVGRVTRPVLGKRGFAGAEIIAHWPVIVGQELAAFACPLEVKYPRGRNAGAALILRVASGGAAAMLHMKTPAILARVNQFFGYAAVVQIQAVQGPLPPMTKPPKPVTAEPAPISVSAALAKLSATLQRRAGARVK